jgi:hypothetical protein
MNLFYCIILEQQNFPRQSTAIRSNTIYNNQRLAQLGQTSNVGINFPLLLTFPAFLAIAAVSFLMMFIALPGGLSLYNGLQVAREFGFDLL